MTIQKLFCKIMLRSFVLILGLISVTELSANPEFVYSASSLESSVTAPQGGGNVKMTGRVLDETKAGVPGATVIVKGSTRGVITGNDGTFSIDVKPTDVIEISYLGYETQSIPVGTKTNIVTELVRKVSELEAVTVVAYGKQRKESIIGAINTIDAGELEVASGSLSSNLAGKLAGIVVMQRTGEPGSSAEFWIRGQSTFGAKTTPLVLVDGIERDMDFVDADDIATFSILKDATATALYGVRGANGIILITTKRGTEMTAPQIRVKAEFGITQPVQLPELANASQWIDYYNELYRDNSPSGGEPGRCSHRSARQRQHRDADFGLCPPDVPERPRPRPLSERRLGQHHLQGLGHDRARTRERHGRLPENPLLRFGILLHGRRYVQCRGQ